MTFVSKHGRRTSTEDLYREVLRRWRKCSATVWLLLFLLLLPHFCYCGALRSVTADHRDMTLFEAHNETTRRGGHHQARPQQHHHHLSSTSNGDSDGGGHSTDTMRSSPGLPRGPLPESDIISSIRQVSASAKECVQRLNATSLSLSSSSSKGRTATSSVETQIAPTTTNTSTNVTFATTAVKSSAAVRNATAACKKQQLPFLTSRNFHQCLYLDELSSEDACGSPGSREQVHLRFCSQYHLGHLLTPLNQGEKVVCGPSFLAELRKLDEAAKLLACQFDKLLELYDCDTSYSVSWTCKECKKAYKQWVCAMVLPFYLKNGELLKPCRSVCRLVEQMCPYFHPSVKEQYAGERVFKCIDPDIPDMESISLQSAFGLPGRCYCPHHLDPATKTPVDSDLECKLSPSTTTRKRKKTTTTTAAPLPSSTTNFSVSKTNGSSVTTAVRTQWLPQRSSPTPNSKFSSSSGGSGAWCAWTLLLSLLLTTTNVVRRTVSNGVCSLFISGREPT